MQYADALNVLILTLPGTPTTYYGEEIAMNEIEVNFEDLQDPWAKNFGPVNHLRSSAFYSGYVCDKNDSDIKSINNIP